VRRNLSELSLATLDVGSMPLPDDFDGKRENVNRAIEDKIAVGLDYPTYPQLPGPPSKPMNMALQYLNPLSKTNPNIQITGQAAHLTSDHITEPSDTIGVERAEYYQKFIHDHQLRPKGGLRACVTGPFTLASYIDLNNLMHCGASKPEVVSTLARILSKSCKRLSDLGFDLVCVDEPFLSVMLGRKGEVLFKYDENFVIDNLNTLISQLSCLSAVHICGQITPLVKYILLTSECDIVDHEFTQMRGNATAYNKEELEDTNKFLAYGCVSSTHPTVEPVEEITTTLTKAVNRFGERLLVKPDCGFGGMLGLPDAYDVVQRTLTNMVAAAKIARQHFITNKKMT
jgi:5-methyltetrahydropteroyltriglutamate--homocysteine methyltransferase